MTRGAAASSAGAGVEIRPLSCAAEVDVALDAFLQTMIGLPFRVSDAAPLVERDRYLGAFDDGAFVGGANSYTSWLVVPGGRRVPHGAVTHVGVLPTHTRRGIVTALIGRQLDQLAARGEVVASLRASEAVIYERFGYGVAGLSAAARLDRRAARLRAGVPDGGAVRILPEELRWQVLPEIYDRASWTGAIRRPPQWWELMERLSAGDPTRTYTIVHRTDGVDDGFAVYHPLHTEHWFTSDRRTIRVSDLVSHSGEAYSGLLRHLLELDLVDEIEFESLPVDDPLPSLLTDHRAVRPGSPRDEIWLRLVDVEAALAARSYRAADPLVLHVTDPALPGNEGSYRLSAEGARRTGAAPDLRVDVASLAAVYLGGTRWWRLARAGRAETLTPGALERADALFLTDALPFSGTAF